MALQACEQRWPVVVGVAPSSKVHDLTESSTNGQIALEPNHSVAVIVPGSEWTDATPVMFRAIEAIRHKKPVIALVVGLYPTYQDNRDQRQLELRSQVAQMCPREDSNLRHTV